MRFNKKDIIKLLAVISAGFISAFNMNAFLNAGGLFPAGLGGVTILIQRVARSSAGIELPYTPIHLALTAYPTYIGYKYIGKKFTLFSFIYTVVSGVLIDLVKFDPVTDDILLIALFGGIIGACAGCICLLSGTSGGGTDFISKYLTIRKGIDGWTVILYFNIGLFTIAGILFGWDKALYSMICQYVSTQVVKLLYKKYQQDTLFIVSDKPKEICDRIREVSNHSATILKGEGSYNGEEKYLVYSIVSAQESAKVIEAVVEVDSHAFINRMHTRQMMGNFYIEKDE